MLIVKWSTPSTWYAVKLCFIIRNIRYLSIHSEVNQQRKKNKCVSSYSNTRHTERVKGRNAAGSDVIVWCHQLGDSTGSSVSIICHHGYSATQSVHPWFEWPRLLPGRHFMLSVGVSISYCSTPAVSDASEPLLAIGWRSPEQMTTLIWHCRQSNLIYYANLITFPIIFLSKNYLIHDTTETLC